MCTVSMVMDDWNSRYPNQWTTSPYVVVTDPNSVPREEFEALKKEVEELKKLLKAAKEYDAATGQPDCEVEEKVEMLKQLARALGVDMKGVFE